MKNINYFIFIIFTIVNIGCNGEEDDPFFKKESGYMTLTPEKKSVGVGISSAMTLTMATTADASGETCTFKASAGSFSDMETLQTIQVPVDINGEAKTFWYTSTEPTTAKIYATVKNVSKESTITVTPVTAITFNDLPAELGVGGKKLFRISVPAEWAGKAIEVKSVQATLQATGSAQENLDTGNRIMPITDANGNVDIIITAPDAPIDVIITASLFGTSKSQVVSVN